MIKNNKRVGVVTFPVSKSGLVPLIQLIEIVKHYSNSLYLITGNEGLTYFKKDIDIKLYGIEHKRGSNYFVRVIRYFLSQIRIAYIAGKISNKIDSYILFIGGPSLLLSVLIIKILKKKLIFIIAGSDAQSIKSENKLLSIPINLMSNVSLFLSNNIIVYDESLIGKYGLNRFKGKIRVAPRHFIDFNKFNVQKSLMDRNNIVGYVGRLGEEKGVFNFVKAMPIILLSDREIQFILVGDGQQKDLLLKYIKSHDLRDKIIIIGWVNHDELPQYLNELKLLILPSDTEGLPNVILEAMACGTPILATPVGAIPDYIRDEETGFIMKDNSPECITYNILRALNHPDLQQIANNGRVLVEKEFTFDKAVARYREILNSL